jgi:hypothetical protein
LRGLKHKVWSFDLLTCAFGEFRKYLAYYIVRGKAICIFYFEELLADDATCVDIEVSGQSHSLRHSGSVRIEHAKPAYDSGLGVSEQWVVYMVALSEVLQDCRAVIADGSQLDASRFKSLSCVLQLHQLRFAEWSPICRTEEKKHRSTRSFECVAGNLMAELVGGSKRRHLLTNVDADQRISSFWRPIQSTAER